MPPNLAGKTLLVTGFRGFLGTHTALMALKTGATVVGVDIAAPNVVPEDMSQALLDETRCVVKEANLSDVKVWGRLLKEMQPALILHLAGSIRRGVSGKDWNACVMANILTTSAMIEAILALPECVRPVVMYPGTQMEYGLAPMPWTEETYCRPYHPYGVSKLAATELLLAGIRAKMFRGCVARFALLYGPAQPPTMFIPALINHALGGVNFKMTEGLQQRRFLYVEDAASLLLGIGARLCHKELIPPLLNMPAAEPKRLRDVAEQILDCMGRPVELKIGALPFRSHESLEAWPDDTQVKMLGFSYHTSFEEGIQRTVRWYTDNLGVLKNGDV